MTNDITREENDELESFIDYLLTHCVDLRDPHLQGLVGVYASILGAHLTRRAAALES